METINLLWTGGLDSTFRLCELSRGNVIVQPYYLYDNGRGSSRNELKAMYSILKMLRSHEHTKADIRDLKIYSVDDIEVDDATRDAYNYLNEKYKLGAQYAWISGFADIHNLQLEVSLESSPRSKASKTLKVESKLIQHNYLETCMLHDGGGYFKVDESCSSPQVVKIFKNIVIPSHLFNTEKVEEVKLMKEWGYEKIMQQTWFCHRPVWGRFPCGHCNPCQDAINEGLDWRVPITGIIILKLKTAFKYPIILARHIFKYK